MESEQVNKAGTCALHGAGAGAGHLVGVRLERAVAAWHRVGDEARSGPLEVWLIDGDGDGDATHVTTGSDWCLIVERSAPGPGYDMGDAGRVEVAPIGDETPFAAHVGERIVAVREGGHPLTGRTVLDLTFESGVVRCESRAGELHLPPPKWIIWNPGGVLEL